MIPPQAPVEPPKPVLPSVSSQPVQPQPQQEDQGVQLTPAEQKKLSIARGDGLRREQPNTEHESGDRIMLRGPGGVPIPCRYCTVNPCYGINWFFEGESRFKCDACGNKMKLGYTAAVADKTREQLEGMDRAEVNRKKMWREDDARREEERAREMAEMAPSPDSVLNDRQFVDSAFFS